MELCWAYGGGGVGGVGLTGDAATQSSGSIGRRMTVCRGLCRTGVALQIGEGGKVDGGER